VTDKTRIVMGSRGVSATTCSMEGKVAETPTPGTRGRRDGKRSGTSAKIRKRLAGGRVSTEVLNRALGNADRGSSCRAIQTGTPSYARKYGPGPSDDMGPASRRANPLTVPAEPTRTV